jgi:hypothetical protein
MRLFESQSLWAIGLLIASAQPKSKCESESEDHGLVGQRPQGFCVET